MEHSIVLLVLVYLLDELTGLILRQGQRVYLLQLLVESVAVAVNVRERRRHFRSHCDSTVVEREQWLLHFYMTAQSIKVWLKLREVEVRAPRLLRKSISDHLLIVFRLHLLQLLIDNRGERAQSLDPLRASKEFSLVFIFKLLFAVFFLIIVVVSGL